MKIGDLCYIDVEIGSPFGNLAGAPCVIVRLKTGDGNRYTEVRMIDRNKTVDTYLLHPEQVHRENRPWMRRHLRAIVNAQQELERIAAKMTEWAEKIAT